MSGPIHPSAVEVPSIKLQNFDRQKDYDITFLVNSINIYESLLNTSLSADIYLVEGVELINRFPIIGEEYVVLSLQTPDREKIEFEFFVDSIQRVQQDENSTIRYYLLHCVTDDHLKNSYNTFSKRYTDIDYDAAVQTTMSILEASKPVNVEKTKGKFDFVVNNVRPFQVIDLIKERAVSKNFKSSKFFFYEDHKEYNFTTLERLIQERKGLIGDLTFKFDVTQQAVDIQERQQWRNILSYEINNIGSSTKKIKSGRIRNQIRQFNILDGTYYDSYEYVNSKDQGNFEQIDGKNVDFNTESFNLTAESKPGRVSMVIKDGLRPEMEHNKNIHYKHAYEEKISQFSLNIRVYGDTNLRVGDIVKIESPEVVGSSSDKERNKQKNYEGNYIVFSQRHRVDREGSDNYFRHYMDLDLRKPAFLDISGES